MKCLVVYESMFGNSEEVARSVAAGLAESLEVDVADVADMPPPPDRDVCLVVAGGPTHAFSMSRSATRADAVDQGGRRSAAHYGLRDWVASLPGGGPKPAFATFDTRVTKVRRLPGSAARSAAKAARRVGYKAETSQSFYVEGTTGPLADGELDRARQWGRQLGSLVAPRHGMAG